ncbi:MAG: ComEC/Rec2 family competence protein, partial [Acidobacteriota bacterium]
LRRPATVRLSAPPSAPAHDASIVAGSRLRVWAQLRLPQEYQNPGSSRRQTWLIAGGVHALGRVKSHALWTPEKSPPPRAMRRWLQGARQFLSARLRRHLDPTRDSRAAVLEAFLLGDLSWVPEDVLGAFRRTGTYHVLVLSGLHLSLLALVVARGLRLVGAAETPRLIVAPAVVFLFAAVVGARPPVLRAACMVAWVALGVRLGRRVELVNAVGVVGALMLAVQPRLVLNSGFWLTLSCLCAMSLLGQPLFERVLAPEWRGLASVYSSGAQTARTGQARRARRIRFALEYRLERIWPAARRSQFLRCLAATAGWTGLQAMILASTSFAVQCLTLPVVARQFNQVAILAFLCNLIVVPISTWLIAWSVLLAAVPDVASGVLSQAALWQVGLLLGLVERLARLPHSVHAVAQPPAVILATAFVAVTALVFVRGRSRRITVVAALLLVPLLTLGIYGCPKRGTLRVSFLDVGQGDAIVVHLPDGRTLVMDGGGEGSSRAAGDSSGFQIGREVVARYLWAHSIRSVDTVAVTHPHRDHAQGIEQLCGLMPCWKRWSPMRGDVLDMAGVRIEALHPCGRPHQSINNRSLVARIRYGRCTVLLTGDIEREVEEELLRETPNLKADLLKVAHHGSHSSSTPRFLDAVQPRFAVVSVGQDNFFGHPAPRVLAQLAQRGIRVYRTDLDGMVRFETDGLEWKVETWGAPPVSVRTGIRSGKQGSDPSDRTQRQD